MITDLPSGGINTYIYIYIYKSPMNHRTQTVLINEFELGSRGNDRNYIFQSVGRGN